jgi:hypothetical protein
MARVPVSTTTWSVDGVPNGNSTTGTITGSGNEVTYTAPVAGGSHEVTANTTINVNGSCPLSLSLTADAIEGISLNLTSGSLVEGAQAFFTAEVFATGKATQDVTWAVDGITGGNGTVGWLDATGNSAVYTAPASTGTHNISATSNYDNTKSVACALTVTAPTASAVTGVTLSPTSFSMVEGTTSDRKSVV